MGVVLTDDLAKDKNYACNYSVNANPSKVNTSQPMSNCCGVIAGTPVLDSALKLIPLTPADQGHLEPFINPAVPNIRFCGNPVE